LRGLLAFLAAASCFVMRGMHKLARFGLRRKR
jgi:hypothetical protein